MAVQTKAIKNRIKSVKNTKKITKAMELVAASKMKRAVDKALQARPYAKETRNILDTLASGNFNHNLFEKRSGNKVLCVVITSNRGLCGAYNAQVLKMVLSYIKNNQDKELSFVTVGKKAQSFLFRLKKDIIASFDLNETISLNDTLSITELVTSEFEKGNFDEVLAFHTDYVSALSQIPRTKVLLPFSSESAESLFKEIGGVNGQVKEIKEFIFEPNPKYVFDVLIKKVSRMQVYHMILECFASEQSARMVAMKNANEAAGEMIEDLTLLFNKVRQAGITQEISEISAGMASIS
jgi:F-type H+-transporting ATPase subunit gamma